MRTFVAGQVGGRRIEPFLKPDVVIKLRRKRPGQPGAARTVHVLAHRTLSQVEAAGYPPGRGRGDGAFGADGTVTSGGAGERDRAAPIPRQQRGEISDLVVGDPGQHVGKLGLGIDVVEPGRLNQRQHDRGALTTAIGAGKQP